MKTVTYMICPAIAMFAVTCIGLSHRAQAITPAPDGGYPGANTAEGQAALLSLTTGTYNTAVGFLSLRSDTSGSYNTGIGAGALLANTGDSNTATGFGALLSNTFGTQNTANGVNALFSHTTGNNNTATGAFALFSNTTGENNIALGSSAGNSLTTGSNNIHIGNYGIAGDSSTIRIGELQTKTFIAGIHGVTTVTAAIPVLIDAHGQLGTMSSSRRFKKEIKPMEKASESILALKPVTFHYNSDETNTPQFGLIAEEVAEINSDLVVRDKNGEIYTVRYDQVNAMLLNEFLKEHRKVEQQQVRISELNSRLAKQDVIVAQQQKGMEVLSAQLEEQAAQIQKVSAQIELNRSMPQMVQSDR